MPGIEQNVEAFLASLEDDVRQGSERLQRYTKEKAPLFGAFALLDPKEVVQTRVIAALLDPFGTHGQGDTFLRLFLIQVKDIVPQKCTIDFAAILSRNDLRETEIEREHLTRSIESDLRRIDLVVRLPQSNIIAIESKARGAKDQKDQLRAYLEHLEGTAKDRFLLIYLSSREVDAAQEVHELLKKYPRTLKAVPYRKFIRSWLDECGRNCRAVPVQKLLNDFNKYLSDEEVPMDKTEMQRIAKVATQNKAKLQSALAVIDARVEIGNVLGRGFLERLKSQISSRSKGEWKPEIEIEGGDQSTDNRQYISLVLKGRHWGKMSVTFHIDGKMSEWSEENGFGLRGEGKQNASDPPPFDEMKMRKMELKHLSNGRKTEAWRCYKPWRPREERMEDTALLLLNPPDVILNELADKLVHLAKDLDGVLRG